MKKKQIDIVENIKNNYDVNVPDYWSKIENAEIPEVLHVPKERRSRPVALYRISAAVCLVLIVSLAVMGVNILILDRFDQPALVLGQDTPIRIGRMGAMKTSFFRSYTFEEAIDEADLLVEVIITEWLGELEQDELDLKTYFRATIVAEYKNNINYRENEIVLMQFGSSKWTYKGYPLFKNGDRLLLCLKSIDESNIAFELKDEKCFRIVGSQLTELQILEKDGQKFALKRNHFYNFNDLEHLKIADSAEVIEEAFRQDDLLVQAETSFECVYSMDDLKDYIDNLESGDDN